MPTFLLLVIIALMLQPTVKDRHRVIKLLVIGALVLSIGPYALGFIALTWNHVNFDTAVNIVSIVCLVGAFFGIPLMKLRKQREP